VPADVATLSTQGQGRRGPLNLGFLNCELSRRLCENGAGCGRACAFSSNLRVAAALAERGYNLRLVLGDGGHDPNHGGAILPDALRWLWGCEAN
jgi:hypothetical protein